MDKMRHIDSLRVSGGKGLALCCIVTSGKVVDVIIRYLSGKLVDNGMDGLTAALPGITAVCGINLLLQYLGPYAGDRFEASYTGTCFFTLENKVLSSEQEQLDKRSIGEFSTCLSSDIFNIFQYVRRMLLILIPDVISFAVCIFLIVNIRVSLGAAALASAMGSVFLMTKLSKGMAKGLDDYQNKWKEINGFTSDSLFHLEMVKANRMEKGMTERYADEWKLLHGNKKKVALGQAFLSAPTMLLSFITLITIAFCGGYFVIREQMSVGQLLSAITLSDYIVSPVMRFQNSLVWYRRATVHLKNFSLFEGLAQERKSVAGVKAASECGVRELSFQYAEADAGEKKVFDGLNLRFEKGKINYIVGNNGAGKSTLIKILGGIYEIHGGEMNLPVKSADRRGMRDAVSIMPQDSLVFADSVKANLLAGTSCSEEKMLQMLQLCRAFGLHDEIRNMDTENAALLSGGQKKRIAFIRCILQEAEVYLFDEPTVGIDRENRIRMMEAISELAERRYVIMITHDGEMMDQYPGTVHHLNG